MSAYGAGLVLWLCGIVVGVGVADGLHWGVILAGFFPALPALSVLRSK